MGELASRPQRWYHGATRGQWMALWAALLGWMFDGFEMGIFPALARPALIELVGETDSAILTDYALAKTASDAQAKKDAKERVDAKVGPWYAGITASFLLGAALGGWVFGWIGDRIGRVRAMVLSVLTYAVFTGLCGLAQAPWQLVGIRFIAALGMGGEWALGVALVMETWRPEARPVLAGLIGAASNVGFVLAAAMVLTFLETGVPLEGGNWRWMLGICAFPALLTFFIRMFVPESERWQHAARTAPATRMVDIFTPALRARTLMGAVLAGVVLVATWGSVQWIPLWVGQMTNSQSLANVSQIVSGTGAIAGTIAAGVFGSMVSRRLGYFAICLGSLIVCQALFWLWTDADWTFMVMVFFVGGVSASVYGWLPLYLPELFPTRVRATGQGFCFNFGRVIAAAGALNQGFLVNQVFGGKYAEACGTISLIYIIGLIVIWRAPETHGKPLPE